MNLPAQARVKIGVEESRMYSTFDVSVPGGKLRVGRWGEGSEVVLAVHGLTATHVTFHALADQLGPDVTLVAPDLRGRGRSDAVTGPAGMRVHADDLAAVLDHLGVARALVVGHSMGAFVTVVAAQRHSDRVGDVVLVDGGLPLDVAHLADLPVEEVIQALVGPALLRLGTRFASWEAYLDFWRRHPALADDWNSYIEELYTYDLVGEPPNLHSSVRAEAVLEDSASQLRSGDIEAALRHLTQPAVLVRAPRGLLNQEPRCIPTTSSTPAAAWFPT